MTLVQIIVLALIQGLTEFLPVSSSAHLILGSKVFGWPDQGLVFDVATHLGTLVAAIIYFRKDLYEMVHAWLVPVSNAQQQQHRSMAVFLAFATLPALVIGALAHEWVEYFLRDLRIIAWATIGFGLLLWLSDIVGSQRRTLESMSLRCALIIGLSQACALIPGASRSGVTITAGRMLGFSSAAAARFSFLLAIPVIAFAGLFGVFRVIGGGADIDWPQFLLAFLLSVAAGWVCIAAFLALLQRVGLLPFVIYRLVLGVSLLWFLTYTAP